VVKKHYEFNWTESLIGKSKGAQLSATATRLIKQFAINIEAPANSYTDKPVHTNGGNGHIMALLAFLAG